MSYTFVKHLHMLCAALVILGFFTRGIWMLTGSARLRARWVRIAPHINDTVLLLAGIYLAWASQQIPFRDDWITVKLLAVLVYIFTGFVAFRPGERPQYVRLAAWLCGLPLLGYIVSVAVTKQPLPWTG